MTIAVLLPLGYGATKLIKRFVSISQLPAITVDFSGSGALSPDGKHFAGITWDSNLVVIDISTGEQKNLGKDFYGRVVWSADGSEIAVKNQGRSKEQAGLLAVSPRTGDKHILAQKLGFFEDWSRDGKLILFVRSRNNGKVYSVVLADLQAKERTVLAEDTGVWPFPCFSPDGDLASYVTKEDGRSILNLHRIDGASHVKYSGFPGDISSPIWSPDGNHIVFAGKQRGINRQYQDLWALRVQGSQFVGAAFPVVPDVEQMRFYNWAQNGQMAYRTGFQLGGLFTLPVDPQTGKATGTPRRVVRRSGLDSFCWSPDGKQIATRQGSEMAFISTSSGETIRNVSLSGIVNVGRGMSWSPDAKLIAFCGVDREKRTGIFLLGVESGDIELLVALETLPPNYDPTWSPDSKVVAYGHKNNVHVVNIEDGRLKKLTDSPEKPGPDGYVGRPVFAADGRSVAYLTGQVKDGKPIEKILMTTIDGRETREVFRTEDMKRTINIFDLSPDGRHIVFTPGDKEVWYAPIGEGEPFKIGDISNVGDDAWAWMPKWSPKGDAISLIVTCEKYQYWVMENFLPAAETAGR
jgi:Tol biopolymer transport system component